MTPIIKARRQLQSTCTPLGYLEHYTRRLMGLLIKSLPRYSGPHVVSTLDLELPVERPRSFGHATLKSTGQPALQLDTLLVTFYYPADQNRSGAGYFQPWVERPLNQTAAGYARFANQRPWLMKALVWLFVRDVRLPVEAERPLETSATPTGATAGDAPSRDSQSTAVDENAALPATKTRIPVVIFSHGLSGTRTTYRCAAFAPDHQAKVSGTDRVIPAANGVARLHHEATSLQPSSTETGQGPSRL